MAESQITTASATSVAAPTLTSHHSPESLVSAELAKGTPRSQEYREGMIDVLNFRMRGAPISLHYKAGTAASDAYFAGNDRGHALWRKLQDEAMQATGTNAEACHV